ncbi:hypothetical protein CCR75_004817 [Bremia lactucae]|uniref:Uncharacterized protein n=1 Tax=Bremia lactucae TaxID=4779 RepID=A0A976FJL1_BRELC|nr:hypothetical protein CCR75_004817 [Bremia lactucae]
MSLNDHHEDLSDGEHEELLFPVEDLEVVHSPRLHSKRSHVFYSIDGVDIERPGNPMAAILEHREAIDRKKRERDEEVDEFNPDGAEESPIATRVFSHKCKRKTLELPTAPARVIRPVAKRFKAYGFDRSITAPACFIDKRLRYETTEEAKLELEKEDLDLPLRAASIAVPDSFQPILWPGDAALSHKFGKDRSHSCSSSSSSKSWASGLGLFCRRSLDVSSPLRVRLNDLVLHSTAGSYTGS